MPSGMRLNMTRYSPARKRWHPCHSKRTGYSLPNSFSTISS
jgi:hypothetical protein